MPELSFAPAPPRGELLQQLRHRLSEVAPDLRWLAEGVLGEGARIDFVAVDREDHVVLVLVAGPGEDLPLVARGLAQRAWLEPRLRDWLQLAPDLGIRPGARVRLLLLCPAFGSESRAAVRALGDDAPRLLTYRCVRNGSGVQPLVDPEPGVDTGPRVAPEPGVDAEPGAAPGGPSARSEPPAPVGGRLDRVRRVGEATLVEAPPPAAPAFRTGLTDADLEISFEERGEFD